MSYSNTEHVTCLQAQLVSELAHYIHNIAGTGVCAPVFDEGQLTEACRHLLCAFNALGHGNEMSRTELTCRVLEDHFEELEGGVDAVVDGEVAPSPRLATVMEFMRRV